jgi:hypothetical protein
VTPATRVDEVWADDILLTFDDRVLEVFGFPGAASMRFHVRNMELVVEEADRKGRRMVRVKPAMRGEGCAFDVPEGDWPAVGAFLDRVLALIPEE